jgi:multidrug efflux pump subunit AcrA (membrane-fusion protein)
MPARLSPPSPAAWVNAALVVLLAGGAAGAYAIVRGAATPAAAGAADRLVTVQQGAVTQTVSADGSVASASTASAAFVTAGQVTAIDVHVGQVVRKGQRLAAVDAGAANRTLDAARADLDAARAALDRAHDAGGDTSAAANQVNQAEVAVTQAQAAVDGTILTAPMAGTVVAVNGTLGGPSSGSSGSSGSSATSGPSGFIDLADLTKLQVTAGFAEADATRLKTGQHATVTWNALAGTRQDGTVTAIDPQATTTNNVVTYGVTVALDAVPAGARPGQTVSVSVTTGTVADAVYVNSAAITTVGNRHTVSVEANGQRQIRAVEIGLQGDQVTQVTSGLQPGERVTVALASGTTGSGTGGFFGRGGLQGGGFPGAGGAPGGGTGRGTGGTGTGTSGTRTGGGR